LSVGNVLPFNIKKITNRLLSTAFYTKTIAGLTINVPVVYMARYVIVLRREVKHHYEGHWKGWALKIETFWALKWQRAKQVPFKPQKIELR
jgi:hypothetical protein